MNTKNDTVILSEKEGFSLVEVVTVVVVLALIALIVAPDILAWRPNMRLTESFNTLFGEIQQAKLAAVEKNARTVIAINVGGNSYSIFLDDGAGGGTPNDNTRNGSEQYLSYDDTTDTYGPKTLPANVNFDAGTTFTDGTTVTGFDPRGLPLNNKSGSIIIRRDDSSKFYRITISTAGSLTTARKIGSSGSWQ